MKRVALGEKEVQVRIPAWTTKPLRHTNIITTRSGSRIAAKTHVVNPGHSSRTKYNRISPVPRNPSQNHPRPPRIPTMPKEESKNSTSEMLQWRR